MSASGRSGDSAIHRALQVERARHGSSIEVSLVRRVAAGTMTHTFGSAGMAVVTTVVVTTDVVTTGVFTQRRTQINNSLSNQPSYRRTPELR